MENTEVTVLESLKKVKKLPYFFLAIFFFFLMKTIQSVYEAYAVFYENILLPGFNFIQSIIPFPLYLIFFLVLFINLIKLLKAKSVQELIFRLTNGILGLIISFLVLWGFHYSNTTLEKADSLSQDRLELLFKNSVQKCSEHRMKIMNFKPDGFTLSNKELNQLKEYLLQASVEIIGTPKKVQFPEPFYVDGWLRKIGISGIYFPFTGEPLFDDSAMSLRKRFTYAHEFFHGIGVTGEDECNYLAFATLVKSGNSEWNYSAWLDVLLTTRHLLNISEEEFERLVPSQILADIQLLKEDSKKYRSSFHVISHKSNDLYLKLLSDEDGTGAYDNYVKWINLE